MQILSIRLTNIKSHRDTELSFSPGINVLSGPNGIGKSTIFEAIGYALFGVDAQSFVGNVERFISIGAKRGEIAVAFELDDGERYLVSRTVSSQSKWLLAKEQGGTFEVEEHKDNKETEARLKELLGLDNGRSLAEQFELVIGPFQHEFLGPFVIKQPTKRRDKFDEILGIDTWRKTFNETKTLASAIKSKAEALQSAIGPLQDQLEVFPEKQAQLKGAQQEHSETLINLKTREESYQQIVGELSELDMRERAIKDISAAITSFTERIENGKEMIVSQKRSVEEAEKAQLIVAENKAAKQAYELVEQQLNLLAEQVKLQRQLERELADSEKQLGSLVGQVTAETQALEKAEAELLKDEQDLVAARKELVIDETLRQLAANLPEVRSAIDTVRKQLGRLEGRRAGLEEGSEKLAEGLCPFFQEPCLNIAEAPPQDVFSGKFTELEQERQQLSRKIELLLTDEAAAAQANEQLQNISVQIKGLDEQAVKLVSRRSDITRSAEEVAKRQSQVEERNEQLAEKQKGLNVYINLQAELAAAEQQKLQHQVGRELYIANQQQAAELDKRRADLSKYETFLDQLKADLSQKQIELNSADKLYNADQHLQLRGQKDALGQDIGALGQKLKNLDKEIVRLESEIEKLKQIETEIKAKQNRIREYGEKEKLVKFLRNKVFRNVSAHLSERFREEISQRADRIYRTIAEVDEELCWGENYQIVLRDLVNGEIRERVDDQLSGGQTMSAVVALRLALLQTIGARVAFFDEPTSNLDVVRRENLAHAFRAIDVGREEVTEHWYDQLFLISHDVAFTEVTDQVVALGTAPND